MRKFLTLSVFLLVLGGMDAMAADPAPGKDSGMAAAPSAMTEAMPSQSPVFLRNSTPINLMPGGFIRRDGAMQDVTTQAPAENVVARATSASLYNARLAAKRSDQMRQQQKSAIPSPFPAGWGE